MKKTLSALVLVAISFQAAAEQMSAEEAYQLDQRLPGALTGRPITIDGVTEAPYGPVGGSYLLTLRVTGAPPASGVQASVPADQKPFVSQLQAGSQVRLNCTGGKSGKTGPWLVNCRP